MPKLINPLGPAVVLTRNFYYRDPVYYLGQHLAADYIRPWPVPTRGAPIVAAGEGDALASPLYDYYRGWMVKVRTWDGWLIGTAHMQAYAIPVNQWVHVKQGDVIGWADNTGVSLGDHCHMDFWNINKKSPEAVQKMGYWAHDPVIWIGRELEADDLPLNDADKAWLTDMTRREVDAKLGLAWRGQADLVSALDAYDGLVDYSRTSFFGGGYFIQQPGDATVYWLGFRSGARILERCSVSDPETFFTMGGTFGPNAIKPVSAAIMAKIPIGPAIQSVKP